MKEFKVGQKAFDALLQEWGKVAQVNSNDDLYPILVSFNNGIHRTYTAEGKRFVSDEVPCLYHEEMAIVPKDRVQRVVQVRDHVNDNWEQRVLIKSLPNETVLCWCNAETINEAKDKTETTVWALWRELPTEPEKVKLTRAEIAEKLGINIDQLEIID